MQKKQIYISGLILIGVIVLILLLSLLFKKKEKDTREIFQKEIAANLKEGYSVKDTIFESLDNKNQQVIAIISQQESDDLDRQDSLVVFELKKGKLVEIFNSTEWSYEFGNSINGDSIKIKDLNKDELKELIVTGGTGGNCWTCEYLKVFQVKDHKVREFLPHLPETQVIHGIRDLNGDTVDELIVLNAEWEENMYMDLCHACLPSVDFIYTWEKDGYQEASLDFPFYYEEKIVEIEKEIKEMDIEEKGSDYYMGKVISIFLNYVQKGEKEKGWEVFKNYMVEENFKDKAFKNMADEIVKDLHRRYFESEVSK
ncbi:MAG: hypothetical protein MUO78_02415 [candidate division Zixibacteria bacterium]|nr:hypothetical protein [candidate division Zixibacteria bacterium]